MPCPPALQACAACRNTLVVCLLLRSRRRYRLPADAPSSQPPPRLPEPACAPPPRPRPAEAQAGAGGADGAADAGAHRLLKHIYSAHPPRDAAHALAEEPCSDNLKGLLKAAISHYHPDKARQRNDDELFAVLCEVRAAPPVPVPASLLAAATRPVPPRPTPDSCSCASLTGDRQDPHEQVPAAQVSGWWARTRRPGSAGGRAGTAWCAAPAAVGAAEPTLRSAPACHATYATLHPGNI